MRSFAARAVSLNIRGLARASLRPVSSSPLPPAASALSPPQSAAADESTEMPPLPSWADVSAPGVTLVRSVREAERVAEMVLRVSESDASLVHAWDTEVDELDLETTSPVGHGRVLCASFYSGPHINYGSGPRVWIDALGEEGDAVLRAFRSVLESERVRKVWHNYGFDRHVLFNHGIDARGFHGDTMHMARLQNTARLEKATGGGYSLAALSRLLLDTPPKTPMLDLFGRPKRKKNGEESKVRELPPLVRLQRAPDVATRLAWVDYSVRDAEVTWELYQRLAKLLSDADSARWRPDAVCFSDVQFDTVNALALRDGERDTEADPPVLLELYTRVLQPFGSLLTDLEREGVRLDTDAIRAAGVAAEAERVATIARFVEWAAAFTGRADLKLFNVHSDMQKAQLLFGLPRAVIKEEDDASGQASGGGATADADADGLDDAELVLDVLSTPRGGGGEKTVAVGARRGRPSSQRRTAPASLDGDSSMASSAPDAVDGAEEAVAVREVAQSIEGTSATLTYGQPSTWGLHEGVPGAPLRRFTSRSGSDAFDALIGLDSSSTSDSDGSGGWDEGGSGASDSEGDVSFAGVLGGALYGTRIGPTGYAPRAVGADEDISIEYEFETENVDGWTEPGKAKPKKKRPLMIPSLLFPVMDRTPKGRPAATGGALKKLVGKGDVSVAYSHLVSNGCPPDAAREAVARIGDLLTISSIDTVLETFIKPLEAAASSDPASRVHCSLNLNTETGRLSARRPNLQNQPSLERDKFRIRRAFIAPPGRKLIVADYGQLELRVLAHLCNCKSMIEAFALGGDFHSRTAMGMYPHVREAVAAGRVALEGDEGGKAVPLLKDVFKEERRKAKILNFSIAYGKTAYGLSKDWGVSLAEAEATVKAWYEDRPEVREWQQKTKDSARRTGKVLTILGRHRNLPGINSRRLAAHSERAAINTPIQGSAADIVMCAMLKIARDERLAQMGYKQVLQVHDEVVLEGPAEHADEALTRVVSSMASPFDAPLRLELTVDAKKCDNWGDAK